MKKNIRKYGVSVVLLLLCVFIPVAWSFAIDWIQYNERLSGANSPTYSDILNRPARQIWANFTSEHNTDGRHKPAYYPTPLPTVTPAPTATPGIDWTNYPEANFGTMGEFDISGATVVYPRVYVSDDEPDIANNSIGIWVDATESRVYLLYDMGMIQKKVELQ